MKSTYEKLLEILEEMGFMLFEEGNDDFAISDYIADSLGFITFILEIEKNFEIELSDDFLNYELLVSAKGFADKIDVFMEIRKELKDNIF